MGSHKKARPLLLGYQNAPIEAISKKAVIGGIPADTMALTSGSMLIGRKAMSSITLKI